MKRMTTRAMGMYLNDHLNDDTFKYIYSHQPDSERMYRFNHMGHPISLPAREARPYFQALINQLLA